MTVCSTNLVMIDVKRPADGAKPAASRGSRDDAVHSATDPLRHYEMDYLVTVLVVVGAAHVAVGIVSL